MVHSPHYENENDGVNFIDTGDWVKMRKEKMTLQEYEEKYIKYEGKSNLEMKPIRVVKAIKRMIERIYENPPSKKWEKDSKIILIPWWRTLTDVSKDFITREELLKHLELNSEEYEFLRYASNCLVHGFSKYSLKRIQPKFVNCSAEDWEEFVDNGISNIEKRRIPFNKNEDWLYEKNIKLCDIIINKAEKRERK